MHLWIRNMYVADCVGNDNDWLYVLHYYNVYTRILLLQFLLLEQSI